EKTILPMQKKNNFLFFKLIYIVFFFSCINQIFCSTTQQIDSLQQLLNNLEEKEKIELLNELSYLFLDINLQEAEKNAKEASNLAKRYNDTLGLGDSYVRLGTIAQYYGDYSEAKELFLKALKIREKTKKVIPIASIYNNLGLCLASQNNLEEAKKYYNLGLKLLSNYNAVRLKGLLYNNLGDVYSFEENYPEALVNLDSSLQIWKLLSDTLEYANTLRVQGDLFFSLGNENKAESNFKKSLQLGWKNGNLKVQANAYNSMGNLYLEAKNNSLASDSLAFVYYSKANELISVFGLSNQAIIYYNLGNIYKRKKRINQANIYYQKSLEINQKLNAHYDLALINYEFGNIYKGQSKFVQAERAYLKSLVHLEKDPDLFTEAQIFHSLSSLYLEMNKNKLAFQYNKLYDEFRDSMYQNQLNAINFHRDLQEEQKEKAQLALENEKIKAENLEKAKINQRNNFIIALLLAGGLILAIMFALRQNRQKRQLAELEVQQAQLETNKAYLEIDQLLQKQEVAIANARLDEKQAIQKQIGTDLHDSLGALLATVKLYFTDAFRKLDTLTEETTKKQQKALDLLDEATQEVRRISKNIQQDEMLKLGLAEAVKSLGNTINESGQISVEVSTYGFAEKPASETDFKLYKIIQELVGNALKHSQANKLTISLTKRETILNILVEDNGIGFDVEGAADKGGSGLKNIAFRASELGGNCHFDSVRQRGTTVSIDIPIENNG
ncbi:MAG: sensor histidine kinase, partial [Bacteroidota bacterium]